MAIDLAQIANLSIGTGDPNGSLSGTKGDLRLRTDGGQGTSLYEKVSEAVTDEGWYTWLMDGDFNTLTYGATIDWEVRNTDASGRPNAIITLTGDATLNAPTGMVNDERMILVIAQDATGGHTLTFPSTFQFLGNPKHNEQASGFDVLEIYYENGSGNFYCHYARTSTYNEHLIAPGAGNVNLDMSVLTNQQIREYHKRLIYLNNLNSTGGGSSSTLPDLDDLWVGYELYVVMRQSTNGGVLTLAAAKAADTIYSTGVDTIPFLDTSGTHQIELGDDQLYQLEFRLVVRDPSGVGALKSWGIVDAKYRFVGGVTTLGGTTGAVDWDLLTGTHKTVTPTGNITLTISNMDEADTELLSGVIHVTQGGTAYDIELPSNSLVVDGSSYLVENAGTRTLENMAASDVIALTYVYDGTNYVWNAAKYI